MKWFGLVVAVGIAFFYGFHVGTNRPEPKVDPPDEICADMNEYRQLKQKEEKFDKANLILAKIMKVFIADLGLHASNKQLCKISLEKIVAAAPPPAPAQPFVIPVSTQTPPSPTGPAGSNSILGRPIGTRNSPSRSRDGTRPGGTNTSGRRLIFTPETAKGAVHALYRAVLWRTPDEIGAAEAVSKFSEQGWEAYVRNARAMVQSDEFLREIEPNHSPQQIINHMYAVYMGRCAFASEMKRQMSLLSREGPRSVVASIINSARRTNADQILAGGFSVGSCGD